MSLWLVLRHRLIFDLVKLLETGALFFDLYLINRYGYAVASPVATLFAIIHISLNKEYHLNKLKSDLDKVLASKTTRCRKMTKSEKYKQGTKINRISFTEKLILMKISETTTIGFASAGHTLCHLLTLLFSNGTSCPGSGIGVKLQGVSYIGGSGRLPFWSRCVTGRLAW